jgi:hypothetical protein
MVNLVPPLHRAHRGDQDTYFVQLTVVRHFSPTILDYLTICVCQLSVLVAGLLLSSRERMTLRVEAIFCFISHTMSCQPEGLGLHIYSWPRHQAYAKILI